MPALALYRGATTLAAPLLGVLLRHRLARGKEDGDRLAERRGVATRPRPDGPLVWLHAASVGEAQSALSLIDRILAAWPRLHMLVTTGTVTSARLLEHRLPPRALHQYAPVDCPSWVRRFHGHWRPDLALWIESELWPNLLAEAHRHRTPLLLINARLSDQSFAGWSRFPGLAAKLLGHFDLCLAQSEQQAERLQALGATEVRYVGNLKYSAEPLPADEQALARARAMVAERPLWLAASTHPGEEHITGDVHMHLRPRIPDLLTVIAPRHPDRAPAIAGELTQRGLRVKRRSAGELAGPGDDIYLADTMGELGLFYRLARIAFIGGSLAPHGGHNPLEPAQLGCAILHGPDMGNFRAIATELADARASLQCDDIGSLVAAVERLLRDERARAALAGAAMAVADANRMVLDRVYEALAPYISRIDGAR